MRDGIYYFRLFEIIFLIVDRQLSRNDRTRIFVRHTKSRGPLTRCRKEKEEVKREGVRETYAYMCTYVGTIAITCECVKTESKYIDILKEYDLYIHNQREELRAITINIRFDAITFNYRRRYVFAQIVVSFIYFNEVFYMDENYYDKYTKLYFC